MIFEALIVAAAFGAGIYAPVNKSMKLDEKALQKYGKAFDKAQSAQNKVLYKAEYTDKRLVNVANKKKAILQVSIPRFVEVYKVIQTIHRSKAKDIQVFKIEDVNSLGFISSMSIASLQGFTDKQLICGIMTKGITGMMVKESEQKLSAAKNTFNYSTVYESQAESIIAVYDAIIERADRIADLLIKMNILFLKSIDEAERTIAKNGTNVYAYNDYDMGVLANSLNMAMAVKDLIDIPVITEEGKLAEEGFKLLQKGQDYLDKLNDLI